MGNFSSGVKAKAMEQMKRISAKYESEWMNKPLNSNLHPIFQILQSKDPLSDLEKFLSENDIRLVFISLPSDLSLSRALIGQQMRA